MSAGDEWCISGWEICAQGREHYPSLLGALLLKQGIRFASRGVVVM